MTERTPTHLESDDPRTWVLTVDGVPGVPYLVAMALGGQPPEPWRVYRYGHVEACGPVDYGPGYGTLLTILFEGGAVVWRPQEEAKKQIQKVPWRELPRIAKALGVG